MDTFSLDTGIGIGSEIGNENGLEDVHDRMMNDPIGIVWQPVDQALFWLIDLESMVGGRPVGIYPEHVVKHYNIGLLVFEMPDHSTLPAFTHPGDRISLPEVLQRYDLVV